MFTPLRIPRLIAFACIGVFVISQSVDGVSAFANEEMLTITATTGPNGSVEPNGVFDVNVGQNITFTAQPSPDYAVDGWYLDNNLVQTNGSTYLLSNIQSPLNVLVTFRVAHTDMYFISQSRSVSASNDKGANDIKSASDFELFNENASVSWGEYSATSTQDSTITSNRIIASGHSDDQNPFYHYESHYQNSASSFEVVFVIDTPRQFVLTGSLFAYGDYGGTCSGDYLACTTLSNQGGEIFSAEKRGWDYVWEPLEIDEIIALDPGVYTFSISATAEGWYDPYSSEIPGVGGGGSADFNIVFATRDTIYVDANSPNDPGSGTESDPFRKIQYGIDAAFDGITVIVAEGRYYENINFNGKNITLTSTDPNDPNVVANTIIDGNDVNTVIYITDVNAFIDGFTITKGLAKNGGGIYCVGSNVDVNKCNIIANRTFDGDWHNWPNFNGGNGGGIYCVSSNMALRDCAVTGNRTGSGYLIPPTPNEGGSGAGIYCDSNSTLALNDCNISENITGNGGIGPGACGGKGGDGAGVYCLGSLIVVNSTINDNKTGSGLVGEYGGGNGGSGAGIWCSQAEIEKCTIVNNITGNGGEGFLHSSGGFGGNGAGLCIALGGSVRSSSSILRGNITGAGGNSDAEEASVPPPTAGGDGGDGGGAYASSSAEMILINCAFIANRTGSGGNGVYNYVAVAGGNGGDGAGIFGPSATISTCTVADNVSGSGGTGSGGGPDGISGQGGGVFADSSTNILNTIICGNSGNDIAGQNCNKVTYSDICDGTCLDGTGNIAVDPCFAAPDLNDYRLLCKSPCIDAGDPNSDYSNEPMPNGGRIDMGAYGNTAEATASCRDSDNDGITDQQEAVWGLDPDSNDTDNDGLTDYQEVCYDGDCNNYNPYNPSTGTGTDLNAKSKDTDDDNMPDCWEVLYPGCVNPLNPADATIDFDGDGFTNLQEYLRGSNPTDKNSIPQSMVFYVDSDAPGDPGPNNPNISDLNEDGRIEHPFDQIQEAIDFIFDRDTIIVLEGTYYENINFNGKNIILTSTDPNDPNVVANTIIDGSYVNTVVTFAGTEDPNCTLSGFTITHGIPLYDLSAGGISGNGTYATISKCQIIYNGDIWYISGSGGIANCHGLISNCSISYNEIAEGGAGGLYNCDGIISNCIISRNIIGDHSSYGGGGLGSCDGLITNCIIAYNWNAGQPPESGGGLGNCNGTIMNCLIVGNGAENRGGGFFACGGLISNCVVASNLTLGHLPDGGGAGFANCSASIINCTIIKNIAYAYEYNYGKGYGGGLYLCGGIIKNCIIWGNIAGTDSNEVYQSSDPCYNCIRDWAGGGIGNISYDPCFADPCNGDYHLKSVAGRWDPNSQSWTYDNITSPCIDAGDPNSDWTAELWPHGKRINMGAYGGTPEASMSPSIAGNIADLDNDGDVDLDDLLLFTEQWPVEKILLPEDLDRSGYVDFNDFVIYADNWLWVEDINLVGLWKFNETAGNYAWDSSGHDNRGKLRNGPVWMGDALYFDGIDDWIEVNDSNSLQMTNQITISVWVYMEQYSTHYQEVVIKPYEQVADPYELYTIDISPYGTFPRFIITDGIPNGDFGYAMNSNYTLSLNHWYQIVGTYDGSIVKLYVNGVLINSNPATLSIGNNSRPVCIGSRLGTYNFKGLVDDVRIYNRALTANETIDLYNEELSSHQ